MLKSLILGFSAFSVGLAFILVYQNVKGAVHGHWRQWGYAFARVGYVILAVLIAELVFKAQAIPTSWRANLYLVGLFLSALGFVIIGIDQHDEHDGTR